MRTVGIIPARYASTRFPGKPLALISGRPMIEWVYRRAALAKSVDSILVATDDRRIYEAVSSFGGSAVMTSPDRASGTDRIAEACANLDSEIVLNIQGDEPLLEPSALDDLVSLLRGDPALELGTLVAPITEGEELRDPNVVKVVTGARDECLYFSRSPIPYVRDPGSRKPVFLKHIGIYGFRKSLLMRFASLPQGELEKAESLEQLRALENGVRIRAARIEKWPGISVDVPSDIAKVEELIKKGDFTPPF